LAVADPGSRRTTTTGGLSEILLSGGGGGGGGEAGSCLKVSGDVVGDGVLRWWFSLERLSSVATESVGGTLLAWAAEVEDEEERAEESARAPDMESAGFWTAMIWPPLADRT
jgi:hypothetical protein